MSPAGMLLMVDRRTKLEGRVNLIFEETSPTSTRVTANVRYVFEREQFARNVNGVAVGQSRNSISFNTGQSASFPAGADGRALTCRRTGKLESDLLNLVK